MSADYQKKNWVDLLFSEVLKHQLNRIENGWEKNFNAVFEFLDYFNNPHLKLTNIIHVTGTNGKGSVCAFIKQTLIESGYRVNVFTSPHLVDISERFFLGNAIVSSFNLDEICKTIYLKLAEKNILNKITYFEICTLIAVLLFERHSADFNIFEVGMGGRLDATNIFPNKLCSIVTSISLDHEAILGKTKELIAIEKIAIARENLSDRKTFIFYGESDKDILQVFKDEILKNVLVQDVELKFLSQDWEIESTELVIEKSKSSLIKNSFIYLDQARRVELMSNLWGEYQFKNAALSVAVCYFLKDRLGYYGITNDSIQKGIANAEWAGRLQFCNFDFNENVKIIIDGSHNQDGVCKMSKSIDSLIKIANQQDAGISNVIGICAFLETKNIQEMTQNLGIFNQILCTDIEDKNEIYKKFLSKNIINKAFNGAGLNSDIFEFENFRQVVESLDKSKNLIVIFGSLYFIGRILRDFRKLH